jgi:hypothetical protein
MVSDPADYRWSSYGEAVGGGKKGNGKKAWEGLVRACMSHKGISFEAEKWKEVSRIYRRAMGMALGRKSGWAVVGVSGHATKNEEEMLSSNDNETVLGSWDGGDVDETGEIFHGRCGDREQRVCERGVRGGAGEVHGEEEGWRAEDAGQRRGGEGSVVEYEGSAGWNIEIQDPITPAHFRNTSRGFAPSPGPTTPRCSRISTMRAARV